MKKVLVACGNGIATSTVVSSKINQYLTDKGIQVMINQCKLMEVPGKVEDYDVLITTGQFGGDTHDTPVVKGMALLTGIGADQTLEEIYQILKG